MKNTLRRSGAIALLLLLLLSAASCSSLDPPDGMQLCSKDTLEYVFFVPNSWSVNAKTDATSAFISLGSDNKPKASVSVTSYGADVELDLDGYWDICEEEYRKEFKSFTFIAESATVVAGKNAKEFVYTADFSGVTYKFSQTVFIDRGMFYIITYTARPDNYDAFRADLDAMRNAFTFR